MALSTQIGGAAICPACPTLQHRADRCYDSPVRVLIVEDEFKSAAYVRKGLSEHGYVADLAGNGEDSLHLAQNSEYDLLDIMLPRPDGWSVLTELRRTGRQTPVLFLTARDSVPDRVKGLDLGADERMRRA